MPLEPVTTHPPGLPEFIQLIRLRPVSVTPPPFDQNVVVRLCDGHLVVAQVSHRSPDDPKDRPGLIARQVSTGHADFSETRFHLYPGWGDEGHTAPFFSNEITHWGSLEDNHRRTIQ